MDLDRIKENVSKMVSMNAPEADIDAYIASEGVTLDQVRAHQPGAAQQPKPTLGETAADVAKSVGIGLAQGAIGIPTLPGNLEALARAGINAGAGALGIAPPVDSDTYLTNYNDLKKRIEGVTGEFYQPKTTVGEYARTIGEFAPLALGGGAATLANRAVRVAGPAVASETLGQATKGTSYEPAARAVGALAGTRLPNVAARTVTPAPQTPQRAQAVQTLQNEGVDALTAGQRTGNERLRWIEDATAMVPGGGGRATAMQNEAAEQFTRAALRRAGIQADRATPDVIDNAFQQIGREYQNFAAAANINPSRFGSQRIAQIAAQYQNMSEAPLGIVRQLSDALGQNLARGISGQQYNAFRSELQRFRRQLKSNPQAANAIGDMAETLDQAMLRSVPLGQRRQVRQALQDRNRRYRNLIILEKASGGAGEAAASGLISPAALKNAIQANDKKGYTRNRNDMAPLARAGNEALTPLRSSGTAERTFAQGVVGGPSAALGAVAGGVLGSGDPLVALAGAAAPWAIKAATARGLMSDVGQRYLANQRIPQLPVLPNQNLTRTLAISEGNQEPTPLRHRSRYLENQGR